MSPILKSCGTVSCNVVETFQKNFIFTLYVLRHNISNSKILPYGYMQFDFNFSKNDFFYIVFGLINSKCFQF